MKKKFIRLGVGLMATASILAVASCGASKEKNSKANASKTTTSKTASSAAASSSTASSSSSDIDVSSVSLVDSTVTYDGAAHKLEVTGTVPEGVVVSYDANEYTNAGEYNVTATLTQISDGKVLATLTATLTIEKADYDLSGVSFEDSSIPYDGAAHSLEITGDLPAGVTVSYSASEFTEIGDYEVTATFATDDANYNAPAAKTATLHIVETDLTGITFEGQSFTYDGSAKTIAITGELPTDVSVEYTVTKDGVAVEEMVNAGTYVVTAHFTDLENHYTEIADLTANVTINKADLAVTFENVEYTYDGTEKSIAITSDLPTGVTVQYVTATGTNAGTYVAKALLTDTTGNYNVPAEKTAVLTINKAAIENITFEGETITYDGNTHALAITGTLPTGVTVVYYNNNQTSAGTYNVTAHFSDSTGNYVVPADQTVVLKINKATYDMSAITFENQTVTYDGASHALAVGGTLPTGVKVIYSDNNKTTAGEYTVTASFFGDTTNYELIDDMTAKLTINKATYDMSGVSLEDYTTTFNNAQQKVEITGTLPTGVTVSYTNNVQIYAGEYTVTASFTGDTTNYNAISSMTSKFTINKATYDMSAISFANGTYNYDGNAKSLAISGTLPSGVTVSYTSNGQTEAGEYTVTAAFSGDTVNYNAIASMTATLTINTIDIDTSTYVFANSNEVYTGEVIAKTVAGLPTWAEVTYTNNQNIYPGTYTVTATITDKNGNHNSATMTCELSIELVKDGIHYTFDDTTSALVVASNDKNVASVTLLDSFTMNGTTYTLTEVDQTIFYNDEALTNLVIPNGIQTIAGGAFYGCSKLVNLTIPFVGATRYSSGSANQYGLGYMFSSTNLTAFSNSTSITSRYTDDGTNYSSTDTIKTATYYIPTSLKKVTVTDTDILQYGAFSGVTTLTEVDLSQSENMTSIGYYAFMNAANITKISLPAEGALYKINRSAFNLCESLVDITIPSTVTTIDNSAFDTCTSLTEITIPASVSYLGGHVFNGCTALKKFIIEEESQITSFSSNAILRGCSALEEMQVPFIGATGLTATPTTGTTTNLGYFFGTDSNDDMTAKAIYYASYSSGTPTMKADTTYYIPSGLTTITVTGSYLIPFGAFSLVDTLTTIDVSNSLDLAGGMEFGGCTALTTVTLSETTTAIYDLTFTADTALKELALPNNISKIGSMAFSGCTLLDTINMPTSLKAIGTYAFSDCTALTELEFAEGLETIGQYAFSGCTGVKEISIPNTVTEIGSYVFQNCSSLETLTIPFAGLKADLSTSNVINPFGIYFNSSVTTDFYESTQYVGSVSGDETTWSTKSYYIPRSLRYLTINGSSDIQYGAFANVYLNELNITGSMTAIGNYAFKACSADKIDMSNSSVETIGNYAFQDADGCTLFAMSDSTTTIGDYALYGMSISDESVHWSEELTTIGKYSLRLLTKMTKLDFTNTKLSTIGDYAFLNNYTVTEIVIPNTLSSLGKDVLYGCRNLESLIIPFIGPTKTDSTRTSGTTYPLGYLFSTTNYASAYTYAATQNVYTSGSATTATYYIPNSLKYVELTAEMYYVGYGKFSGCTSLEEVKVLASTWDLSAYSFYGCTGLKKVSTLASSGLWSSRPTIGKYAFYGCTSLTDINVYNADYIYDYAFYGCTSLVNFEFGGSANYSNPYTKTYGQYSFAGCTSLAAIEFGSKVTQINANAFLNCTSLTTVTIPNSCTTLGASAFEGCTGLTFVEVGSGISTISEKAFYGCTGLTRIVLPTSLTEIKEEAFAIVSGTYPTKIYYKGTTTTAWSAVTVDSTAFTSRQWTLYYYAETQAEADAIINAWYYDADGNIKIWATV